MDLQKQQRWFWALLLLTGVLLRVQLAVIRPLTVNEIVAFELAGSAREVGDLLTFWRSKNLLEKVRDGLVWDLPFLAAYSLLLAFTCRYLTRLTGESLLIRLGKGVALLALLAGMADAVENYYLWQQLAHGASDSAARRAAAAACTKFGLLTVVLLFGIAMGFRAMARRTGMLPPLKP